MEMLGRLVASGGGVLGDLYVDHGITGNNLSRPAFDALCERIRKDKAITHVFVYMRDRFARPELVTQAMELEIGLLHSGIMMVFHDKALGPRKRGQNHLAEDIQMHLDYAQSGDFLNKLAERVLDALKRLAEAGHWAGGRAPYGFGRVLVDQNREAVRDLDDGETVRKPGHHVELRPKDLKKIETWLLILDWYSAGWGAKRIANELNKRGIPSPDAGRARKDRLGIKRLVPGCWGHTTVLSLIKNAAIAGIVEWGTRSEGIRRRLSAEGPRNLEDSDFSSNGEAKVVTNPLALRVIRPANYKAPVDPELFVSVQKRLEQRGRVQRGITRAHDPNRYPLSGRVFDASPGCASPMYGITLDGRSKYVCGLYLRTAGSKCRHNTVRADSLLKLGLSLIKREVQAVGGMKALRGRLLELAKRDLEQDVKSSRIQELSRQVLELSQERDRISENLARAKNATEYEVVSKFFEQAGSRLLAAQNELKSVRSLQPDEAVPVEVQVEQALALFDNLDALVRGGKGPELLRLVEKFDLRFWLHFEQKPWGKRNINRMANGVLTSGNAAWPIEPYYGLRDGPAGDNVTADMNKSEPQRPQGPHGSDLLQKVRRGERI